MKAVWLSSTYYFDEAVQELSPNAERMLTRGIAFCGNAETGGYITLGQINMLGLPNAKRLLKELVDGEILVPQPDGRWYFDAWPDWNSSGDKLIARQKADRERQARRRATQQTPPQKSRDESRDKSRDVTPPEERREEQNSGYVSQSATEPDTHGVSATPGAALVRELIPNEHPASVRTMLRLRANELLKAGHPRADVAAALELWLTKPSLGPNALPSVLSEVLKARAAPNGVNGRPPDKLRVLAELAAEERSLELAAQTAVARKELA